MNPEDTKDLDIPEIERRDEAAAVNYGRGKLTSRSVRAFSRSRENSSDQSITEYLATREISDAPTS